MAEQPFATLQREQIEQWLEGARDPLGHPGWHPTNGDIKALCELALSALSETTHSVLGEDHDVGGQKCKPSARSAADQQGSTPTESASVYAGRSVAATAAGAATNAPAERSDDKSREGCKTCQGKAEICERVGKAFDDPCRFAPSANAASGDDQVDDMRHALDLDCLADREKKLDAIAEALGMPKESWRIAGCDVLAHAITDTIANSNRFLGELEKIDALLDELGAPVNGDWGGVNTKLSRRGRIKALPSSNGEMNGLRLSNGGINQPVRAGEQTPVAWLIEHGEKEIVYGKRRYITFRDANDPTFWLHDKRPSTTKVTPLYTRSASEQTMRVPPADCRSKHFRITVDGPSWTCDCGATNLQPRCFRSTDSGAKNG
jgi:hypothetical protein